MKLSLCCLLLLPFANVVLTAPVRARRENVLTFLNDALDAMDEPHATANTKPPNVPKNEPVTENTSEDVSDANSSESLDPKAAADPVTDLESHEVLSTNNNSPSPRKARVDKDSEETMDVGRAQDGTDPDSEEGATADAQKDARDTVDDLDEDQSLDVPDLPDAESAEENKERQVAAGNIRDTDHDDTKELTSNEKDPQARIPGRFSFPSKIRRSQ